MTDFDCSRCGKRYQLSDDLAPKPCTCPRCGALLKITIAPHHPSKANNEWTRKQKDVLTVSLLLLLCVTSFGLIFVAVYSHMTRIQTPTALPIPSMNADVTTPIPQSPVHPQQPSPTLYSSESRTISDDEAYYRDVATIKKAVLEDTIDRGSARFCPEFVLVPSKNDNRVYVGWYRSKDLLGEYGQDNIIAEMDQNGSLVQISIGEF
jgi:DNA-directed RNA polymerase subunit RPC12/RpoP